MGVDMPPRHRTTDDQLKALAACDTLEQLRRRVSTSYDALLAAVPDDVRTHYLEASDAFRVHFARASTDRADRAAYLRTLTEARIVREAVLRVLDAVMRMGLPHA
jgi:Tfp pilus assembly protein PilN